MDTRDRKLAVKDLQDNVLPTLQTGDIILTSNKGIIVYIMNLFQKDRVNWGHTMLSKDNVIAYEAGKYHIKEHTLKDFFENKIYWKILRKKDLNEIDKVVIKVKASKLLGKFYGIWRLVLQLFDQVFQTNKFSASCKNENIQVCSSYVSWIVYESTGYKINGIDWMSCDPDDIEDELEKYPERWEVVAERLPKRSK